MVIVPETAPSAVCLSQFDLLEQYIFHGPLVDDRLERL